MEDMTSILKTATRVLLGSFMVFAGVGHLSFARKDFQAQVPDTLTETLPISKDFVVLSSGVVEIGLGLALLALKQPQRKTFGRLLAAFYVAVFPGNLGQYLGHKSAFGLDTDQKRLVRLFFQPVLIAAALWSTDEKRSKRRKV